MAKIHKIKIYTHHGEFTSVFSHPPRRGIKSLFASFGNGFFYIFYLIGVAVIKILLFFKRVVFSIFSKLELSVLNFFPNLFNAAKLDISETKLTVPERFKLLLKGKYVSTLAIFVVTAGLAWAALSSLGLVALGLEMKDRILQSTFLGKSYLNRAKDALVEGDFSQADNNFYLAFEAFNRGQKQMEESGQSINRLLSLLPQKRDAESLLKASELVSAAGIESLSLQEQIQGVKFGAFGVLVPQRPGTNFFPDVTARLFSIAQKIEKANGLIAGINEANVPEAQRQEFLALRENLSLANLAMGNLAQIFDLMSGLLSGEKNLLFVFQNNNELRASGGFMGTYGNVKLSDGKINKIEVSSVYDLDGQLAEIIQPPRPMLNVNDRWFLRDSNWFADFPLTAEKISHFYELEGGQTPDAIIALTPNLIVDWLKIVGPIELPTYSVTLTPENFVEQVQAISSLSENSPSNEPKQILADLFPILLQKLSETGGESWLKVMVALQNSLNSKHLMLYSRDESVQKKLSRFNWDGGIKFSDRDFLSVVSTNLGGTKTDLNVEQSLRLVTNISSDGTIINELEITRTNSLPVLPQTENISFLRVFVPPGSKMLNASGFDVKNLEYFPGKEYVIDEDVYEWEKKIVTDKATKTIIGQEAGKTFFGNWLILEGGQSKTVKIVYQLPFKLSEIDRYSLLLQKQPGAQSYHASWQLNFSGRKIEWKNFDPNTIDAARLISDIMLDKDYFFGLVFNRKQND